MSLPKKLLVSQAGESQFTGWHREVFDALATKLAPKGGFPCTFSQNAFKRGILRFHFVESLSQTDLDKAMRALTEYVSLSATWDGSLATAHPLIMAFSRSSIEAQTVQDYHKAGWEVLQYWHDHDPSPWPDGVSQQPDTPFWSYCHSGMQLFVNMSCPAHQSRQSRHLGAHFIMIINPRERFDIVAGDTRAGRKVRQNIRDRIKAYDGEPHAPQLGSYEAGEIEWWQYGLSDKNQIEAGNCPFHQKPKSAGLPE